MEDFIYDIRWREDEKEWRACARRELVISLWQRYGKRERESCMLDVGCGTGVLLQSLGSFGGVIGIDVSVKAVSYCRIRGLKTTAVASAERPCFINNYFDLITMVEVLEHVEDDLGALKNLQRLLKPGGIMIMTVPAFQFLWSKRDERLQHKRRYTASELLDKIKSAGMRPVYYTYIDLFLLLPLSVIVAAARVFSNSVKFQAYEVSAPYLINGLLLSICRAEQRLCARFKLPVGVSLVCVAQKANV